MIDEFGAKPASFMSSVVTSLDDVRYLSAMKHCNMVIGDSSSGVVEAPALKKELAVNVEEINKMGTLTGRRL